VAIFPQTINPSYVNRKCSKQAELSSRITIDNRAIIGSVCCVCRPIDRLLTLTHSMPTLRPPPKYPFPWGIRAPTSWIHPSPYPKRHLDGFSRFTTAHGCHQQTDRRWRCRGGVAYGLASGLVVIRPCHTCDFIAAQLGRAIKSQSATVQLLKQTKPP